MTDVKTCEKEGCENTFDVDLGEGVTVTTLEGNELVYHYYCCLAHKP